MLPYYSTPDTTNPGTNISCTDNNLELGDRPSIDLTYPRCTTLMQKRVTLKQNWKRLLSQESTKKERTNIQARTTSIVRNVRYVHTCLRSCTPASVSTSHVQDDVSVIYLQPTQMETSAHFNAPDSQRCVRVYKKKGVDS